AAAPYEAGSAAHVIHAQACLAAAQAGLDPVARLRFLAPPRRRRVAEGNHIAFSLPTARPARRAASGPLGFGMGGL
ncbi:MAG: hypothetical protein JWM80_4044, partial [Cyanobacteria bacterium RYN_339]|nr:hypothetical protein [Cyanobacteria bacterium RYN_339]